jgi:hypothetical protein
MSIDKFHLFVIDKMFGADQRKAQRRRRRGHLLQAVLAAVPSATGVHFVSNLDIRVLVGRLILGV